MIWILVLYTIPLVDPPDPPLQTASRSVSRFSTIQGRYRRTYRKTSDRQYGHGTWSVPTGHARHMCNDAAYCNNNNAKHFYSVYLTVRTHTTSYRLYGELRFSLWSTVSVSCAVSKIITFV